jgi:hypothetical protein
MPRTMSSAMLAAIQSGNLQPALFVTASFLTGPIYVWTGYGSIAWGGHTWLGVGTLGTISVIEEGSTVEAKGVALGLSGIDPTLLADVLTEFQIGAPVAIYLGLFSGAALIADPIVAWAGRMDQATIDVSGQAAVISLGCENRLLDMNVSSLKRLTNDQQQFDYPGDRGCEFVSSLAMARIFWGTTPTGTN